MWERVAITNPHGWCSNALMMSHLLSQYGPSLSSKAIRHALLACAYALKNGIQFGHKEILSYTVSACGSMRSAANNAHLEITYASYFLAQGCWVGKSIVQVEKSTIVEMLTHLSGFTTCLHLASGMRATSHECLLLKYSWYNTYAMVIRFLTHHHGTGFRRHTEEHSQMLTLLKKLSSSWWEAQVDDCSGPL